MTFKLSEAVAKNRAEEFPDDLWGHYVLPLDYESSNLHELTKGAIIEGGRGSGKTMFLKYHCHATMFSKNRSTIPDNIFKHIGIYWKPDTSFTQLINENWLGKSYAIVFNTYASLCILSEFTKLCNSVINSRCKSKEIKASFSNITLPKTISNDLNISVKPLSESTCDIRECLYNLTNWINFPDSELPPYRMSLKSTVEFIVEHFRDKITELRDTTFHILIDEYENLSEFQQQVINTFLKHSDFKLIFSVAHKKNARVSNKTLSQEKIVDTNDFRRIDLESIYLNDLKPTGYEVLASEILTLKLFDHFSNQSSDMREIISNYSNPEFLNVRKDLVYQDRVRSTVRDFFESTTLQNVSRLILEDPVLRNKLLNGLVLEGLKKHNEKKLKPDDFIDLDFPEASLVNGAVLNRNSTIPSDLKANFEAYKAGDSNSYSSWISNNLYGVILFIYNTLPKRVCPLYVGFSQFILMSKGNLRYFLELCYQTFVRAELDESIQTPISLEIQGKATKATSTKQLEKIEELGSNGIHLKRLAKRLGALFSLSQKRRSQSESEVNHFTIATSDLSALDEDTEKLLNEAIVWSVLFSTKGTKTKSNNEIDMVDFVLHPVLACHFGISPRKKRKLKFDAYEIKTICYGKEEDFKEIQNKLVRRWDLEREISMSNNAKSDSSLDNGQYTLL